MNYYQITILFLQGFLVVFVILLLFRLRKKLGLGVLFACLGLFQFVQVFLSSTFYVPIADNFLVTPGSAVFFTLTLFTLLAIYIKEDASETKKIIYALLIINIIMSILLIIYSWHFNETTAINQFEISTALIDVSARVLLVGTIALFLDSLLIIIIFEFISKKIRFLFLQICITMFIVVSFDTLFFFTLAFWNSEDLKSILISGFISKSVFTLFYSIVFYVYLKYFDFKDKDLIHIKIKDVFKPLSYKQKFDTALDVIKKAENDRIVELEFTNKKIQKTLELLEKKEYTINETSKIAKIGFLEDDLVTGKRTWSENLFHLFGFDPKDDVPSGKEILALFDEESRQKSIEAGLKLDSEGVPLDIEVRMINLRKDEVWLRIVVHPVYNDQNEIVGRRGIMQDITKAKKTQNELGLSKQKIEAALELAKEKEYSLKEAGRMAKIGYWKYDKLTDTIFWSEAVHRIYGTDFKKGVPDLERILSVFSEESRNKLIKSTVLLANEGIPFEIELELTNFNNETRWIRNIGEAIYNDKNEIVGRRGVSQDITDQKIKQQTLDFQTERLFELNSALNEAQKLSHVGSWKWDMTTDEAEWSDEMYNIYGVVKGSFYPSNENVSKMVLPEDLHKLEQGVNSLFTNKKVKPFEFRIRRPSGEIRILYIMALEKKSEKSIFGVTKDVTEQKQIEEKNFIIKERYRMLFNNSTASIWNEDFSLVMAYIDELRKLDIPNIKTYLDQNPEVVTTVIQKIKVNKVNKTTLKLFKAKSNMEFIEKIENTFSEQTYAAFEKLIISIWNYEKTFTSEVTYKTLEGDEFAAIVSIPIPQTEAAQKTVPVSIQSIQSIKEAELAKKESLDKLNEAQKLAKIGSWILTPSTQVVEWSEEAFHVFGFDPKKGVPDFETQVEIIHPEDKELVLNSILQEKPFEIEHRIIQLDGVEKWIRSICKPVLGDDGEVINLSGTCQDITLQKRAVDKIKKADEMYRILTDNSNDLICLQEPDSSFKYISPSVKSLLGYEQSDFLGKKVFSIVHKDDIELLKNAMEKKAFKDFPTKVYSFRVRHKKGYFVWLEFSSSPVYKEGKISYFVTTARDITEGILAKQAIQEYQQSLQEMTTELTLTEEKQKKEIALNIHDHLSQSLVISKMRINELKKNSKLKITYEDLTFIEKNITEALENSRKITYELSPPVLYQLGIVDALNWLLDDVENLHKIKCKLNSNESNIKLSDAKAILLYRCIQELIKNTVKYAKASLITLKLDKNQSGITILLTDDGVGFDTSVLNNNKSHTGTGFGLFTVQERIQNIQGKLTIQSKINKGTTVTIFIPE
ncbi:PAS domain-containing protein [Xanthomarina gelatinilytica]|uniref:PAS domain-containing protein n=1 Tax=Xanthomarina gelatinilytica TaxID=1137281 RepID=UPI003AA7AC2F